MRARYVWPAEPDAFAFYPDLAAARRHLAAEDAHECGLASGDNSPSALKGFAWEPRRS
jgi:hypothetical protein